MKKFESSDMTKERLRHYAFCFCLRLENLPDNFLKMSMKKVQQDLNLSGFSPIRRKNYINYFSLLNKIKTSYFSEHFESINFEITISEGFRSSRIN